MCPCQDINTHIDNPVVVIDNDCNCHDATPLPDCEDGERCAEEAVDAGCVVYTDEPLPGLGIKTNDRLNKILKNLSINSTTQAIAVMDSKSITLTGSGLASDKLKATVILDSDSKNLLKVTDDGLLVKLDAYAVLDIIRLIASTPELKTEFCGIATNCLIVD